MYTETSHIPDPVTQPQFYRDVPLKRGFAWLIDAVLILALVVPVVIMTAFIGLFFLPVLFLFVGFIYRVVTISNASATFGMRMMNIELRDSYGKRLDGGQAFLHTLGYTISMSVAPLQLISIVMMFLTERRQGLSDMFLGTVMINRRA